MHHNKGLCGLISGTQTASVSVFLWLTVQTNRHVSPESIPPPRFVVSLQVLLTQTTLPTRSTRDLQDLQEIRRGFLNRMLGKCPVVSFSPLPSALSGAVTRLYIYLILRQRHYCLVRNCSQEDNKPLRLALTKCSSKVLTKTATLQNFVLSFCNRAGIQS